jgi:hypothetical protein
MKRYLASAAVAGCLFAICAGTAGAKANGAAFDVSSQSGFISRGDVIAAGGKDALVASPVVRFTMETRMRLTCTWPDNTQRTTTMESTLLLLYRADTRVAENGTITGYFLSKSNQFDAEIIPPFTDETATCWSLLGVADNGTPVQTDETPLGTSSELTFFGPSGAFDL